MLIKGKLNKNIESKVANDIDVKSMINMIKISENFMRVFEFVNLQEYYKPCGNIFEEGFSNPQAKHV
jgi:hypothetical protein